MNRLYYDCPIEAAYMAKNFGVKFLHELRFEIEVYFSLHNNDISWLFNEETGDDYSYTRDKFYIDPDSLPIFEPMEGDIITDDDINPFVISSKISCDVDDKYVAPEHIVGQDKTIFRDGKPFITPKREENND